MDEEKNRKAWDEYHQKLDPMGKKFMDLLLKINDADRELWQFLLERGQLYGAMLYLMEMTETSSFEMSLEDMNQMRNYMIFFSPNEDNTGLIINKREHEYRNLQEPARDVDGDSTI